MAVVEPAAPEPVPPPRRRCPRPPAGAWAAVPAVRWGLVIAALAVAIAFPWIRDWLPNSDYWLPMTTVLIMADFMLLALGLNIVVGYAGLLDLGYVAFWAIGAYCAGWFMSSFFVERDFHFLSAVPETLPGHPHQLLDRLHHRRRRVRRAPASSSARPPCGCAATTSRS